MRSWGKKYIPGFTNEDRSKTDTLASALYHCATLQSLNWRKKGNVLFNNKLNTFCLRLYGVGHMVKDHSDSERKPAAATWATFRLAARVLLYAPSHRQNSTYHGLCYTSLVAQAGTRNISMGPPRRIDPTTHRTTSERSYHRATLIDEFIVFEIRLSR